MYAVFTGKKIFEGLSLVYISDKEWEAEDFSRARISEGRVAEAIKIQIPSSCWRGKDCPYEAVNDGNFIVLFNSGPAHEANAYGPFEDYETAEGFAEDARTNNEEKLVVSDSQSFNANLHNQQTFMAHIGIKDPNRQHSVCGEEMRSNKNHVRSSEPPHWDIFEVQDIFSILNNNT